MPVKVNKDTEKRNLETQRLFLVPFEGKPLDMDALRHRYKTSLGWVSAKEYTNVDLNKY